MESEDRICKSERNLEPGLRGPWQLGWEGFHPHSPLLPEHGEQGCQKHTASQAPQKADAAFRVRLCPKQLPSLVLPSQPRRAIPVQPRSCVRVAGDSPNLGTGGDLGESNPCQDTHFLGSLPGKGAPTPVRIPPRTRGSLSREAASVALTALHKILSCPELKESTSDIKAAFSKTPLCPFPLLLLTTPSPLLQNPQPAL